jgi:hypothetical protein
MGQVFLVACGEIIDAEDGMALGQQAVGEVGPEKAGGAGYEDAHGQNFKAPNLRNRGPEAVSQERAKNGLKCKSLRNL